MGKERRRYETEVLVVDELDLDEEQGLIEVGFKNSVIGIYLPISAKGKVSAGDTLVIFSRGLWVRAVINVSKDFVVLIKPLKDK